ncbi:MAG TPA: ABC transporter ATP-binding protein [Planctomycetota bacterium]|nr:ABC transporter ATP-binding protein [Planctomycetota bacterium]
MSASKQPILSVRHLSVAYASGSGLAMAIEGIDFDLAREETLAVVGESGSGKSTLGLCLLGLLPANARVLAGEVRFEDRTLDLRNPQAWSDLRGTRIGYVPQDTQAAFDPLSSLGSQIEELLILGAEPAERVASRALELLREAGLADAAELARELPERLSGGQRQRAAIAAGLARGPALLIADEPTSSLDPVHARGLIDLLDRLRRERKLALLWISHDLQAVAARADRTLILYAGRVIESGPSRELADHPLHPYTRLLLRSLPHGTSGGRALAALPPAAEERGAKHHACRFSPRCPLADERCRSVDPPLALHGAKHWVACHYVDKAVNL